MSAFPYPTNYPPPAVANGVAPPLPQQYPNPAPPVQYQQKQPQQLQQPPQQQQPQQQHHQPKLPMQMPLPTQMSSNNLSKFLPPSAAAPPPGFGGQAPSVNGPTAAMVPPHMRPPGLNGPAMAPLTNGAQMSANSSRTASPRLQQPLQSMPLNRNVGGLSSQSVPPSALGQMPPSSFNSVLPTPTVGNLPPPPMSTMPAYKTNAVNTTATQSLPVNMQNLNLNGPITAPSRLMGGQQIQPPPTSAAPLLTTQTSQKVSSSYPASFQPPPQPMATSTPRVLSPLRSGGIPPPPIGGVYNGQLSTGSVAPNITTASKATVQNLPPGMHPRPPPPLNANYPPSSLAGGVPMPPPPMAGAPQQLHPQNQQQQQQNQMNNNQLRSPLAPGQLPTMPPLPNMQLPAPLPSSQPYSQVYQQQAAPPQPPPPGAGAVFNGQPNRGPMQYQNMAQSPQGYASGPNTEGVVNAGFSRLWGQDTIDLMQNRHILSPATMQPPKITLHNQFQETINCNPNIMRCTVARIPESNSLLQKSRLPLGILIHPFRDINNLPVIQCPSIVRCRLCRTYINPFVYFVDSKMWKCNLCYRVNELPEDFQFDPATKTYGDVTRRPEVRSSTIEFIAPSEYMLRPPQPAIYLFLFDVSIIAQQSGYLENVCAQLIAHLDRMPGDKRTQVGFIAYNSFVHFYSMSEGFHQPHELTLLDIDDPFLPRPDTLLVNLHECKDLIREVLTQLPLRFSNTHDAGSAMGSALQCAYQMVHAYGGRITVFQTCLPNLGPGALLPREDPNNRSSKDVAHLNPATDFYKRFALECSGYQVAVDLFLLNQQYSDLTTISGISKHSGGCVHHFPLYQKTKLHNVVQLRNCIERYLTRKIGFEAVMRIRCTRGLQVHTFHGNFFVRSTDLLSLPNVNPDAGYGMQISYDESLTEVKTVCFQAALLYTNSEGERRIRVHTLCLPVTSSLAEVMHSADIEAIVGMLSKMAVDRSVTSTVADAREAFLNVTIDIFNAFKLAQNLPTGQSGPLIAPRTLALLPMYILALLKHPAFRVGTSTRLDDRVYAMDSMKSLPLDQLMKFIYPFFYQIDLLFYHAQNANVRRSKGKNHVNAASRNGSNGTANGNSLGNGDNDSNDHSNTATDSNDDEDEEEEEDEEDLPAIARLQLSAEHLDSRSVFLMDCGNLVIIYVGFNVPDEIVDRTFGYKSTAEIPDYCYGLPTLDSAENYVLRRFIMKLNEEKPYQPLVQIIRDTSTAKPEFMERLVDDRSEASLSYYEFLQHIRAQVK